MPYKRLEFRKESTQEWVTIEQRDPADEDGLRILTAGGSVVIEVTKADIPGNSWNSWNQQRLNRFVEVLHERLTTRIPIASLPDGDPDKTTDPNRYPLSYWDGSDLCSRALIISNPSYDPVTGITFDAEQARVP